MRPAPLRKPTRFILPFLLLAIALPASAQYTIVQFKATNSTTNFTGDNAAGFFNPSRLTANFYTQSGALYPSAVQGVGNLACVAFTARAASIAGGQSIAVSDTGGNSWSRPAIFFPIWPGTGFPVMDEMCTTNTTGSVGNDYITVTITMTGPGSPSERIALFYLEALNTNGVNRAVYDTGVFITENNCGTSTVPCPGVAANQLSPAMSGTSDFCAQIITGNPGQTYVTGSPWATNWVSNGDHSAASIGAGLNSSYTTPEFYSSYGILGPGMIAATCWTSGTVPRNVTFIGTGTTLTPGTTATP